MARTCPGCSCCPVTSRTRRLPDLPSGTDGFCANSPSRIPAERRATSAPPTCHGRLSVRSRRLGRVFPCVRADSAGFRRAFAPTRRGSRRAFAPTRRGSDVRSRRLGGVRACTSPRVPRPRAGRRSFSRASLRHTSTSCHGGMWVSTSRAAPASVAVAPACCRSGAGRAGLSAHSHERRLGEEQVGVARPVSSSAGHGAGVAGVGERPRPPTRRAGRTP